MNKQQKNFLTEGLKLVSNCPVCKSNQKTKVQVMEGTETRYLLHVSCQVCNHAILTIMEKSETGVSCIGIVTDLDKKEAKKLLTAEPIEINAVLELHDKLEKKDFIEKLAK